MAENQFFILLGYVCGALCTAGLSGVRGWRAAGKWGARSFYRDVVKCNSFLGENGGSVDDTCVFVSVS